MKIIKEKNLNIEKDMNIKYGTSQRKNPEVIYLSNKFWLLPNNSMDFENVFEDIKENFQMLLTSILRNSQKWHNKFISDFDIKFNGLQPNKKSFVSIEFYIRQKGEMIQDFKSLEDDIVNDFKPLFENLKEDLLNYNFSVSKTKYK